MVCVTGKKGTPVAIGRLERFVADWERERGEVRDAGARRRPGTRSRSSAPGRPGWPAPPTSRIRGHEVTIFEALHKPGGVLVYGIPEFRLPKGIVQTTRSRTSSGWASRSAATSWSARPPRSTSSSRSTATTRSSSAPAPACRTSWASRARTTSACYSANEFLTRVNLMKAYDVPRLRHAGPPGRAGGRRRLRATSPWTACAPRQAAGRRAGRSASTAAPATSRRPAWRSSSTPRRRASTSAGCRRRSRSTATTRASSPA